MTRLSALAAGAVLAVVAAAPSAQSPARGITAVPGIRVGHHTLS